MFEIIGIMLCILAILHMQYPHKTKFYIERIMILFNYCPNCKKFSMYTIKNYKVCSSCRKR
jgi:hypothetical protein